MFNYIFLGQLPLCSCRLGNAQINERYGHYRTRKNLDLLAESDERSDP
jgi:hypothetical protein